MPDLRQGGCLCGAARYEIDVADHETGLCHCSLCKKHSGSAFMVVTNTSASRFQWTSKPLGECFSSESVVRRFCRECGTPLTWESKDYPDMINIGTGTLDNPTGLKISYEMYTSNRLGGIEPVTGARQMGEGYELE